MISIAEIKNKYSSESALLLLCIRCHFKTAEFHELGSFVIENPIEWETFRRLVSFHRISPIAYRSLANCGTTFNGMEGIKTELQQCTIRNWQLAIETERILELFEKKSIKAVPYKGTMFSKQFYGDLVSRLSSDIDLLISWDDLQLCIQLLKNEGYTPEWQLEDFHGWNNDLKNSQNEYNMDFYKNGARLFHIELHWDISNKQIFVSKNATKILQNKKENVLLLHNPVPCLTDASHFITIILHHASKDVFRFLRNLVDIAQAAERIEDPEEWVKIKEGLTSISHMRSYEISGELISSLIGIDIRELINTDFNSKTILLYQSNLLDFEKNILPLSATSILFSSFHKRYLQADSFRAKLKQYFGVIKIIVIPNFSDYQDYPLPRNLFFLYYFRKPYRLFKRHFLKQCTSI